MACIAFLDLQHLACLSTAPYPPKRARPTPPHLHTSPHILTFRHIPRSRISYVHTPLQFPARLILSYTAHQCSANTAELMLNHTAHVVHRPGIFCTWPTYSRPLGDRCGPSDLAAHAPQYHRRCSWQRSRARWATTFARGDGGSQQSPCLQQAQGGCGAPPPPSGMTCTTGSSSARRLSGMTLRAALAGLLPLACKYQHKQAQGATKLECSLHPTCLLLVWLRPAHTQIPCKMLRARSSTARCYPNAHNYNGCHQSSRF
jgi:hypothetical protein